MSGCRNHRRITSAFTLVELLTVIAIIAILAAILFPVFGRAREKARQAACLSHMRQISMAVDQYQADFDSLYPPSQLDLNAPDAGTCGIRSWPSLIYVYVASEQVFTCPSSQKSEFPVDDRLLTTGNPARVRYCGTTYTDGSNNGTIEGGCSGTAGTRTRLVNGLSYGRNLIPNQPGRWIVTSGFWSPATPRCGFSDTDGGGTSDAVHEAQVDDPAGTVHIMDAMTGSATAAIDACSGGDSLRGIQYEDRTDYSTERSVSKVSYRHSGGFNVIFGDGHVKWRRFGSTRPQEWTIQAD